ncbi:MAG: T9SS type A sorting domain-containing protein, partial [Ignavibacteria bacterium]
VLCLVAVNSNAQWQFVGFVTGAGMSPSISAYGPNGAVVFGGVGGSPRAFLSTNGGVNWTAISGNMTGPELFCGWAVNASTMFGGDGGANGGAGGNARVWKTTNGGSSWTVILSTGGSLGFFNGIVFSRVNPNFGMAQSDGPAGLGTPFYIATTTNGGNNWTVGSAPGFAGGFAAVNSVVVVDALFYGFGSGNVTPSRVEVTSNGGTTWTTTNISVTGNFVSGFTMSDDKLRGLASTQTSLPNISRTTNGCATWATVNIGAGVTGYCNVKWIHGTSVVYVAGGLGAGGVVKRSSDGGLTWTQMSTQGITDINHMEYHKESNTIAHIYAVAGDGSVIRYRDSALVVGINPINNNIPAEYRLEQNYPNPFNPSTTINYSLPRASSVTIKIYDMLGHEVMTVVEEHHPAGNYTTSVDASTLASGVYFYTLNAGDFTDSKKMILVK